MFDDIINKPDSYDEEFSKEYAKWMEDYGKLIKKDFEKLANIQPIDIDFAEDLKKIWEPK